MIPQRNATDETPAFVNVHGAALILPAAALHHLPDHLFAKGKCFVVVEQLDFTGFFAATAIVAIKNEQIIPHEFNLIIGDNRARLHRGAVTGCSILTTAFACQTKLPA
jgi:hypothetical protein